MTRISIGQAYDPVEVEFFGHEFETVDVTRSAAKKAAQLSSGLENISDADPDGAVDLLGQLLDLKLISANGKKSKASTLLKQKWNADEVSVRQVLAFLGDLAEAEGGERPT